MGEYERKRRPAAQTPPVRRRRRKRRPKWQRVLRKYWPTIRFGLVCLALLVLLIYAGKLVVSLISGTIRRDDTTETIEPTETKPSLDQIQAEVDALIQQADFVAAGYDYERATDMLKNCEYYDQFADRLDAKVADYAQAETKLVSYDKMNEITHVFFHTLVAISEKRATTSI